MSIKILLYTYIYKPICYSIYLRTTSPQIKPLINTFGGTDRFELWSHIYHQETTIYGREELSILTLLNEDDNWEYYPGCGKDGVGGGILGGGWTR